MPEITLRATLPSDTAFLRALFNSHRAAEFSLLPLPAEQLSALLEQQFQAQQAQYHAAYPDATYSIVLLDGQPIGRLTVAEEEVFHLVEIALLPAFQGQGFGGRLVSHLLAKGEAEGKAVRLSVQRFNPAQRLYFRLGFAVVADDGMYLNMEWGPPRNYRKATR